jgi:hypothetical protein
LKQTPLLSNRIRFVRLLILLTFALATARASAALVIVNSTSELGPEGKIFWGDFGNGGTLVPAGSVATVKSLADQSALDTVTVGSGAPDYNGPFVIYNVTAPESKGIWETGLNFTPGDRALDANWSDYGGVTGRMGLQINKPWEFTFAQPVSGFGAQANATEFGSAGESIAAYDSSNKLLGNFSVPLPGIHTNPNADGTAPFFGVLSNAANISRIEFNVYGGDGEGMINSPYVRLTPDANIVTLRGDFNRDGKVTNSDLQAMLNALQNLNAYKQTYFLSDADLRAIGDFVGSDGVNTGDIKPLMNLLTGNSPLLLVPEPNSLSLALAAATLLLIKSHRTKLLLTP